MERVLLLLTNLDSGPGADRADAMHGKTTLLPKSSTALTKDTMFSTFFTHLMQRLPPALARRAVRRLGAFAAGGALPSVALEAAGMFRAAAAVDPQGVVEAVVRPLAKKVAAEMPEKGGCFWYWLRLSGWSLSGSPFNRKTTHSQHATPQALSTSAARPRTPSSGASSASAPRSAPSPPRTPRRCCRSCCP